jgi:hypothetical protein
MTLTKSPAVNIAFSEYLATGQPLFIGRGVLSWKVKTKNKNSLSNIAYAVRSNCSICFGHRMSVSSYRV